MTKTLSQSLSKRVFTSPDEFKFHSSIVCLEHDLKVWSPKAFLTLRNQRLNSPLQDLMFLEPGGLLWGSGWGGGTFSEPRLFCRNVGTLLLTSVSSVMCLDRIHLLGRRCKVCRLLWVLLRGTSSMQLKVSLGFHFQSTNDLEIVCLSSSSSKYLCLPSVRTRPL